MYLSCYLLYGLRMDNYMVDLLRKTTNRNENSLIGAKWVFSFCFFFRSFVFRICSIWLDRWKAHRNAAYRWVKKHIWMDEWGHLLIRRIFRNVEATRPFYFNWICHGRSQVHVDCDARHACNIGPARELSFSTSIYGDPASRTESVGYAILMLCRRTHFH